MLLVFVDLFFNTKSPNIKKYAVFKEQQYQCDLYHNLIVVLKGNFVKSVTITNFLQIIIKKYFILNSKGSRKILEPFYWDLES